MDENELRRIIAADRDSLTGAAPPLHFARLWHEVRRRREASFDRRLALVTALPSLFLLLIGVAALVVGDWHVATPFCVAAFWIAWQVALPRISLPEGRGARSAR